MSTLLRTLTRQHARPLSGAPGHGICRARSASKSNSAQEEMDKFWAKNEALKRPMSPHLTIYRWSVPMAMSIMHRMTGVGMSGAVSAFAVAALAAPPGSYAYYLDLVHSLPAGPGLVGLAKFAIALPLSYHTFNGVRHLWWDTGKGLKMAQVRRSGYAVIALSVASSLAAAFLHVGNDDDDNRRTQTQEGG